MAELFGFRITRANQDGGSDSFTSPVSDDGTLDIVSGGGHYASVLDMDGRDRNEVDLIRRYRDIAQQPECDSAVEDIVNEAIVSDERDQSVSISLDRLDVSQNMSRASSKYARDVSKEDPQHARHTNARVAANVSELTQKLTQGYLRLVVLFC